MLQPQFASVADVAERLGAAGYLTDDAIATTVFLADRLGKPLLVEGPAGVGKTELAKAVADGDRRRADPAAVLRGARRGPRAVRVELQEAAAAHPGEQGRRQRGTRSTTTSSPRSSCSSRPLLTAIRRDDPTVLLIDETDKADVEVEGLLLEVLSATSRSRSPSSAPSRRRAGRSSFLTSNATRELSEALKRRCLYLHLDYPSAEREKAIVLSRVPEVAEQLAEQLVRTVRALRALELKKSPSIAESIDWARTLLALGLDTLDEEAVERHARRRPQARQRPRARRRRSSS